MTKTGTAQKLDIEYKAILFIIVFYFPVGFGTAVIHELGHILICTSEGNNYDLWFDATGGHMRCKPGQPANQFLYNAMGGTLGLLSAAGLTLPYLARRHFVTKGLAIAALSFVVLQIENLVLETFYTVPYEHHVFDVDITAIHSFALMVMAIVLNLKIVKRPSPQQV